MKVNITDCTFTVVDGESTWAYDVDWSTCEHLLRYLKGTDTSKFKVLVAQGGVVTHIVPFDKMVELANI